MHIDRTYKKLLKEVLKKGYWYDDPNREGVRRLEIPSYTLRHEFDDGFPAISLKKLAWKSVVTELLWFLRGDTNIKYLIDNGCNIWNKDGYRFYEKCYEKYPLGKEKLTEEQWIEKQKRGYSKYSGDLGKIYGYYWRNFNGVDQIAELIDNMINNPMSSELLVVARDPSHKGEQALPSCHYGFQIVMRPLNYIERFQFKNPSISGVTEGSWGKDDKPMYGFELHWKQRSCDLFLGIPFNIASYALLALILEEITGHKALAIQGDLKKVHLYDNSVESAKKLLERESSDEKVQLLFKDEFHYITDKSLVGDVPLDTILNGMKPDWFKLEGYNPQPAIKVEMLSRT